MDQFQEIKEALDKHELYEDKVCLTGLLVWALTYEPPKEERDVQD